jgi:hypothetical protein
MAIVNRFYGEFKNQCSFKTLNKGVVNLEFRNIIAITFVLKPLVSIVRVLKCHYTLFIQLLICYS